MKINFKNLTVQVLTAIIIGILIGLYFPAVGVKLKVLGDIFIKMIKMVIAPIIFLTIVLGFANMVNLKKAGRIGGKALIYFELVTTIAMLIGFVVAYIVEPGAGVDVSGAAQRAGDMAKITKQAANTGGFVDLIVSMVPDSAVGTFTAGATPPLIFFSVICGIAMASLGEKAKPVTTILESVNLIFFKIVSMIMRLAPIAAGGAMAYTIGYFGIGSLLALGKLMACTYITLILFIVVGLGLIARFYGFSIFNLLMFIKEEILLVLGTASSESALPSLMRRLEEYGCSKSVVGLVVPTGYVFNTDGNVISFAISILFLAQAYGVHLSWSEVLLVFGVLTITSKGSAGVVGLGFVTLTATVASIPGQIIPLEGLPLLLGVDRFLSEIRSITNMIGNAVAAVVIAKSENAFNPRQDL